MARNVSTARTQLPQPIEYSSRRKRRAEKRKLRLVTNPKKRPSAEVAAERIRTLILELGEGEHYSWGWKRRAYRSLGLNEHTGHEISTRKLLRVGTTVMDQICNKLGISIADLMDED